MYEECFVKERTHERTNKQTNKRKIYFLISGVLGIPKLSNSC